jgi:hypothetical protein
MTIRAITEILEDAISTRCVKNFRRKYQKTILPYVNKAFLSFDKEENHSSLKAFPIILHS